jgi:hypothetical protein|tara:strand:- start:503 stop:775 length:273 start_codon:yes stop_codon:yes gene_type:complete
MKYIKNWVAPIRIFIAVIISTVLALLTMVVMVPVGYLFNVDNTGGLMMFATIQLVYLISTLNYFFEIRKNLVTWKRNRDIWKDWTKKAKV